MGETNKNRPLSDEERKQLEKENPDIVDAVEFWKQKQQERSSGKQNPRDEKKIKPEEDDGTAGPA